MADVPKTSPKRNDWQTLKTVLPYIWEFRSRVFLALLLLICAKFATVSIPLVLKQIVDALDKPRIELVLPIALLIAYGALRFTATVMGELRDAVFAKATQRAVRRVALKVFNHLHRLALRFHLERQTGGLSRDIERGTRGIGFVLNFMVFNIVPTIVEIALVAAILLSKYDIWFAIITFVTLTAYIGYTMIITEWRMIFRRTMNEMDSKANSRAIDSLINYETVKYFGNEEYESHHYDQSLQRWERAAVRNQTSLATLNAGQSCIIAVGVTSLMTLAAMGVVKGTMTLGDLVLVNAYMIQLYMPLHFLGFVYREIKHSLADMDKMFTLLNENAEVKDKPDAPALVIKEGTVRFEQVNFSYEENRQILCEVSFEIPAGHIVAVVGSSGAGKSTLSRLMFRFYDVSAGRITIDGQDIRDITQKSLRTAIGIVPQDTVLFNDTILHNIAYGRPDASREEVVQAAMYAHIHQFIERLPEAYETVVGERGLKLSGGEKQRVAIARAILKNPPIMIFDEATSALDSKSEKAIQAELRQIAENRTTLVIAHRLSTVVDANQILVMDHGRIVERGTHRELLAQGGMYTHMWALQQQEESVHGEDTDASE